MRNLDFIKTIRLANQSKGILHSTSTKMLTSQQFIPQINFQNQEVLVPATKVEQEMKINDWRAKTEFPIIKIHECRFLGQQKGLSVLLVKVQKYPFRLNQLRNLPLFKAIYILKQSLIGFERLFDKFGTFPITPKMIALTQQNKCKVWLNQNFTSNDYYTILIDQQIFVRLIFKVVEQSTIKVKTATNFFLEIMKCCTFCQAFGFIQNYTKENKISVPNTCRVVPKEIIEESKGLGFNPHLSMHNSPKRVINTGLRVSLKGASSQKLLNFESQSKIVLNQEDKQSRSKRSGETATDIDQSVTFSGSNNQERYKVGESNLFEKKKNIKKFIFQSQVSPSQINTFQTSTSHKGNVKVQSLQKVEGPRSKLSFLSKMKKAKSREQIILVHDQEHKEITKKKQFEVYQKNNWAKSINCLISDSEGLKTSVQFGRDKFKTENSQIKLRLLDNLGKNMTESVINNHNKIQKQWYPSTNQF